CRYTNRKAGEAFLYFFGQAFKCFLFTILLVKIANRIFNPVGDFDKQDCEKKAFKRLALGRDVGYEHDAAVLNHAKAALDSTAALSTLDETLAVRLLRIKGQIAAPELEHAIRIQDIV
ncbi:MAG: hypothetical protein D3905_13105, partial [Candidatus Electrothrix sp. AS4_5]|nr:hypothetical protein [Candidatus Electrothrix gigas]